jgi:hypothetical protein
MAAKRTFTKSRHLLGAANSGSRRLSMALLTIFKDETKQRSGNQGWLPRIRCREDCKNFHALTRGAG